jgi:cytochrome c-type biogenesis protein CcmH/NrfG
MRVSDERLACLKDCSESEILLLKDYTGREEVGQLIADLQDARRQLADRDAEIERLKKGIRGAMDRTPEHSEGWFRLGTILFGKGGES